MATLLPPPKHVADFSPWTGHHPEDVLNETVVKAGYCDKGPGANQAESNSGKPAIWQNLTAKNNTGLQMLSYLFTQVMEKRQALGKCSAPSTFKPPPRVTVTDTKREAWLKDLANPEIPLRKQSRTIPHGIRGKLLMDQCLKKDIPLQRAVWLAKCVGANELRAFKRKGVSGLAAATGESKWVHEWTLHVEQFLENVITSCPQQDWQLKMTYAIKLATALYAEQLLDANHYLDWIVSSFNEADMDRLPMWMIMVQIHWKDIVGFIRRGRRLAESILVRLHTIANSSHEIHKALELRLRKLVAILAVTSRGCLVIPATWKQYSYLLTPNVSASNGIHQSPAEHIARRNEILVGPASKTSASTRGALLQFYDTLDSTGLEFDLDQLTNHCLSLVPVSEELVPALLEWASSPYRHGLARMYITAKLISTLRKQGHDTDAVILRYLGRPADTSAQQDQHAYKVIVELVRLGAFNVGPYLQWLISSGAICGPAESQRTVGLLAALPTGQLPPHVANLRRTLLGRIEGAIVELAGAVPITQMFDAAIADHGLPYGGELLNPISLPVKVATAEHVRNYMRSTGQMADTDLAAFCIMRDFLECTDDIVALAELLTSSTQTDNSLLLATMVDTAVVHLEALAALGELQDITMAIIERYRVLRSQQPLDRILILALDALVQMVPGHSAMVDYLASDLKISEQQNTAAVCSPASDSLIGMYAASLDSDEDIDAVFASGNTMDDQLLQRVLMRVLHRADKADTTCTEPVSKVSSWLNQLRIVGGYSFNLLLGNYCWAAVKGTEDGLNAASAIATLVASGCIYLGKIVEVAKADGGSYGAKLVMNLLLSSRVAKSGLSILEKYNYRASQRRCLWRHPELITRVLLTACEHVEFDLMDSSVIDLLVMYTNTHRPIVKAVFEEASAQGTLPARAHELSKAILHRGLQSTASEELSLQAIVHLADPLSIYFAAGELWWTPRQQAEMTPRAGAVAATVLLEAIQTGNAVWPQLLGSAVDAPTKSALHGWAQEQLLFAATRTPSNIHTNVDIMINRNLDVLDLTHHAVRGQDDTAVLVTLNDRLRDMERQLTSGATATMIDRDGTSLRLRICLHVCTLHLRPPEIESEGNRQARANLLATLCSLLLHPRIQTQPGTVEYIFDLASVLSDSLPDTALASIARTINIYDPHTHAILGGVSAPTDTWLALVSQAQNSGGTTAQQRALAKHPSAQAHGQPSNARAAGALGQGPGVGASPQQAQSSQRAWPLTHQTGNRATGAEEKSMPFPLRRWEIMPDPTPVMGENDTSLSLGLFGARRV
ncbi:RNA polymerase II mediator complex subunit [Friedmanniomyces endolithicus]|uniref:Mediator of RNA polymerase II transcription subunit 12 n=1 Tax=Friedmanniomyces endolithicus TaxID=329885 RepID=A0AAN6K2D7_9PEZI|nr:RNA polymerase II mediator complex subunit [Friedmanniomyces endolithicus]KAK0829445.1 RNA polymerase II mediator complex subunit [Friedmanniomyces endolithicus]KAK0920236.1 RNA polymerase II mediator complex subunit [Friedmanniomyces endolithicus]KAK0956135.1 RNA polymerase II mediator complex subunit [Friedmanniomyces endolithicus]KAK1028642.1 RNA polymerase II mediator complex subunit [Friedmanniomyces endolithicus]